MIFYSKIYLSKNNTVGSIHLRNISSNLLKISSILFGVILLADVSTLHMTTANVESPKRQQDLGLSPDGIF